MKTIINKTNQKWEPLKRSLAKKDLTLAKLRQVEDEVLLHLTGDGDEGKEEILGFIDAKREVLIQKEISDGFSCNVLKMMEIRNTLPPEDWEERIALMKRSAKDTKSLKTIERLEFGFHEPLVYEFNPEAIESTFASRMEKIAKEVSKTHSLSFYESNLTSVQKRYVEHFLHGTMDPDHIASAVYAYVKDLRKQIKAAEAFYFGRMKEGLRTLHQLSQEVQQRVDDLMVEAVHSCGQTTEAVVAAILHSVEEQMGMHEAIAG